MKIKGRIIFTIKNSDGSVDSVSDYPMKSFLVGFMKGLAIQLCGNYVVGGSPPTTSFITSIKRANATDANMAPGTWVLGIRLDAASKGIAGDATVGILIGTGTTPPSISDFTIQTKINHGAGAGQMQYAVMDIDPIVISGTTTTFSYKRVFTNNSGSSITINEVVVVYMGNNGGTDNYTGIRDIVSGGRLVGNTQSVEVKYTIAVTA